MRLQLTSQVDSVFPTKTHHRVLVELPDEVVERLARVHGVHEHARGARDARDELELGLRAARVPRALRVRDLQELARRDVARRTHLWKDLLVDVVEKVLVAVAHNVRVDCTPQQTQS